MHRLLTYDFVNKYLLPGFVGSIIFLASVFSYSAEICISVGSRNKICISLFENNPEQSPSGVNLDIIDYVSAGGKRSRLFIGRLSEISAPLNPTDIPPRINLVSTLGKASQKQGIFVRGGGDSSTKHRLYWLDPNGMKFEILTDLNSIVSWKIEFHTYEGQGAHHGEKYRILILADSPSILGNGQAFVIPSYPEIETWKVIKPLHGSEVFQFSSTDKRNFPNLTERLAGNGETLRVAAAVSHLDLDIENYYSNYFMDEKERAFQLKRLHYYSKPIEGIAQQPATRKKPKMMVREFAKFNGKEYLLFDLREIALNSTDQEILNYMNVMEYFIKDPNFLIEVRGVYEVSPGIKDTYLMVLDEIQEGNQTDSLAWLIENSNGRPLPAFWIMKNHNHPVCERLLSQRKGN